MPEPSPEDKAIVDRVRTEHPRAVQELFDRYAERLVSLAKRRLSQGLARRVDPEDIVQSVFRTFFGRLKQGQFKIEDQDDLCKLLVRITVHKTIKQIAYHKAAKRDPSLETGRGDESQHQLLTLLARDPTPEDVVTFQDQWEHFLKRLGTQEQQILEMRLQGYSNEEIAEKLGIYDRKIRRVIERVRGIAEKEGLIPG